MLDLDGLSLDFPLKPRYWISDTIGKVPGAHVYLHGSPQSIGRIVGFTRPVGPFESEEKLARDLSHNWMYYRSQPYTTEKFEEIRETSTAGWFPSSTDPNRQVHIDELIVVRHLLRTRSNPLRVHHTWHVQLLDNKITRFHAELALALRQQGELLEVDL
jgi:hypothetical protein